MGLDLGGTKSAASLCLASGRILRRVSKPTPVGSGADALCEFLASLATDVARHSGVDVTEILGVGISAGAPTDPARGIVFAAPNMPDWGEAGYLLADRLRDGIAPTLGRTADDLTVRVENDADATALAEHRFGAGQGAANMAFLTIGTGIGAGLILNGRLHRGRDGAGGEIGHICVVPDGLPCKCGLRGCLEAYASGPALLARARALGFDPEADGRALVDSARAGNPVAASVFADAARLLGGALATLTMLLNIERIVLGTMAVHAGDLLLDPIRETFTERCWPRLSANVEIVPAALGDRAQDLAAVCAFLGTELPGATTR